MDQDSDMLGIICKVEDLLQAYHELQNRVRLGIICQAEGLLQAYHGLQDRGRLVIICQAEDLLQAYHGLGQRQARHYLPGRGPTIGLSWTRTEAGQALFTRQRAYNRPIMNQDRGRLGVIFQAEGLLQAYHGLQDRGRLGIICRPIFKKGFLCQ